MKVLCYFILCYMTCLPYFICESLFSVEEFSSVLSNNHTEYISLCDEEDIAKCYDISTKMINSAKFIDPNSIDKIEDPNEKERKLKYNNFLSDYWYNAGLVEYWGIIKKKPKLIEGFSKFVVSAYFGNPKALYKLYIIIETDILKFLFNNKEFESLKKISPVGEHLRYIFNETNSNFSANFYYNDEYEKNSIALQFLYSSALFKYQPALTTLAYKFYKGYGVERSCDTSLKYYKESSSQNVKEITKRHKPNYYEKINLATYEYIGHKFSTEILDVDDIIDYFKVEAQNGQINYIQQLGQRYLYGQGIPQDFSQAFYYFEMGSKLNDSVCIYYLGELYLNGWGVEKNYSEAFRLFSHAMTLNNPKSWNSLGYMYYYGLGVEKNIKRAYDYFKISFSKGEESDAYYNMATLLTEGNGNIEVDFANAYKYTNFIAAKGHTFGTHFFGMLNEYQLGSIIKTCEITVEFFKQVSERNLIAKKKFDNAIKLYRAGYYKIAALIYIELAEEGYDFGQVNSGLLLKNYDIFVDSDFNKFLSFKYFKMAHKSKNIFATLILADFYHYGFGDLDKNYTKAITLYRKVILSGTETMFYISHAYFNLGQMNQLGRGVAHNTTKALKFYNLSSTYESNALYPGLLMKLSIDYETANIYEIIFDKFTSIFQKLITPGWPVFIISISILVYLLFLLSLYLQKD